MYVSTRIYLKCVLHGPVVHGVGRRDLVELIVIRRPINPSPLRLIVVIVVRVVDENGAVVKVGRQHKGLAQDPVHQQLRLLLPVLIEIEGVVGLGTFPVPVRGKVSVEILVTLVESARAVGSTLALALRAPREAVRVHCGQDPEVCLGHNVSGPADERIFLLSHTGRGFQEELCEVDEELPAHWFVAVHVADQLDLGSVPERNLALVKLLSLLPVKTERGNSAL